MAMPPTTTAAKIHRRNPWGGRALGRGPWFIMVSYRVQSREQRPQAPSALPQINTKTLPQIKVRSSFGGGSGDRLTSCNAEMRVSGDACEYAANRAASLSRGFVLLTRPTALFTALLGRPLTESRARFSERVGCQLADSWD